MGKVVDFKTTKNRITRQLREELSATQKHRYTSKYCENPYDRWPVHLNFPVYEKNINIFKGPNAFCSLVRLFGIVFETENNNGKTNV